MRGGRGVDPLKQPERHDDDIIPASIHANFQQIQKQVYQIFRSITSNKFLHVRQTEILLYISLGSLFYFDKVVKLTEILSVAS